MRDHQELQVTALMRRPIKRPSSSTSSAQSPTAHSHRPPPLHARLPHRHADPSTIYQQWEAVWNWREASSSLGDNRMRRREDEQRQQQGDDKRRKRQQLATRSRVPRPAHRKRSTSPALTASSSAAASVAIRHDVLPHGRRDGSTVPTSIASTEATSRSIGIRAQDKDFVAKILKPRGVSIVLGKQEQPAHRYFDAPEPEISHARDATQWYHSRLTNVSVRQEMHPARSDVWVHLDEARVKSIQQIYDNHRRMDENESRYSFTGKKLFFLSANSIQFDGERHYDSYCTIEDGPDCSRSSLLVAPPIVDGSSEGSRTHKFNTKPDLIYWLTTDRLNPAYRSIVPDHHFAFRKTALFSPYLFVDFKKETSTKESARQQVASAASTFLYNRFRLRCQRLAQKGGDLVAAGRVSREAFAALDIFGMTFANTDVDIFCVSPQLDTDVAIPRQSLVQQHNGKSPGSTSIGLQPQIEDALLQTWQGCRMTRIVQLNVEKADDIRALASWINEIHCYGLGKYANNVVLDIKGICEDKCGGIRFSYTPDEMAAIQAGHGVV